MSQSLLDNPWLIQVAVFGLIATVAWLAVEWISARRSRAEERLEDYIDPLARRRREEAVATGGRKNDAMTRMLEASAPALARPLQPKSEQDIGKLKMKLSHAGFRSQAAPQIFLGIKVVMLAIGVVLGGGTTVALMGMSQSALFRVGMIAGVMFYLPEIILYGLPDALDLMVVCVEGASASTRQCARLPRK
jgi:tight adherence protein C